MKRAIFFVLCFVLIGGSAFCIDLLPVGRDIETFFEGFGEAVIPYLQQNALAGEGLGIAQFSDNTGWYIAVTPAVVLSHGVFDFIKDGEDFEVLNVDGLIGGGLSDAGAIKGLYEGDIFPIPFIRLNVGFALPSNFELGVILSVFPQFVTNMLSGAIGLEGVVLNRWNAGLRLRKPLISDDGGFPAISIGVGYTITNFNFGIDLPDQDTWTQDIYGVVLSVDGDMSVNTWLHTFGVDLTVSKKLAFFVPFVKLSSYYHIASFKGEVSDFEARANGDIYSVQGGEDPSVEVTARDLAFLTTAGFEILLGKFAILFDGNYSFDTSAFALNFGIRMGFGGQ
jgi:hypothetical protein